MTQQEYFRDWYSILDITELNTIMARLSNRYKEISCNPDLRNIFKTFELCTRKNCKVVFLGQNPYSQNGKATGLAFANWKNTSDLSASLKSIKNCILDLENPHNLRIFDHTLESIAKQGVLFLNTALTTEVDEWNSHQILWRKFIENFLKNLNRVETGLIFVLMGVSKDKFKHCFSSNQYIIECEDPAFYIKMNIKMPNIFERINEILNNLYGETIQWYNTY